MFLENQMKRFVAYFALISAVGFSSASAEEYILRVEELIYKDSEFQAVKELHAATPNSENSAESVEKPEAEIQQAIEIQIRPGERFYSWMLVRDEIVPISGELTPAKETGKFQLDLVARNLSESAVPFVFACNGRSGLDVPANTFAIRPLMQVGKTLVMGPIRVIEGAAKSRAGAKKGTFLVHTVRLEGVDHAK
jgi:hypothetical protein